MLANEFYLNAESSEPLYRQVGERLRSAIRNGSLRRGERLPATRELAERLNVNRATISSAYALLEAEGLLSGHVGKGSFVSIDLPKEEPSTPPEGDHEISFSSSRPSAELFPVEEFSECCAEVMASSELSQILQLGSPHGYAPLRKYLLDRAKAAGVAREDDDILITSGCQQAMDLLERLLVSSFAEKDGQCRVLLEDPVYPGVRNVFSRGNARLTGVPIGERGFDLEAFETAVERERPHLAVITPSFQNPTGCTLSFEERERLISIARKAGVLLIENGIYADLRYQGGVMPPLKQLAGDVILVQSFSKLAFPGLRVGWVLASRRVIAQLASLRHWCDLHTDQLSQALLLHFAESGRLDRHRDRVLEAGKEKLAAVLAACERHLPVGSLFSRPDGGMSLWVRLPAGANTADALEAAARQGVSYLAGPVFAVGKPDERALRLSFAGLRVDEIAVGVERLGRIFRDQLSHGEALPAAAAETALV